MSSWVLADGHVHIYPRHDLGHLLASAWENLDREARACAAGSFTGVLCLTERAGDDWFATLSGWADSGRVLADAASGSWSFARTTEPFSLIAEGGNGRRLILIAGRQMATSERLEVLALGMAGNSIPDNLPLEEVVSLVLERGALAVVPWAVGKWLGARAGIVARCLEKTDHPGFCLGDNGGRPVFWPRPALFGRALAKRVKTLPGSDPLPFPAGAARVGGFGFKFRADLPADRPGAAFLDALKDKGLSVEPFGRLERPLRFFRDQAALRRVGTGTA